MYKAADTGRWCYAFEGDPPLTLGASFMQHHLAVFDRSAKRIGFARSACPTIEARHENGDPAERELPLDVENRTANLRGTGPNGEAHDASTSTSFSRLGANVPSPLTVLILFLLGV